MNVTVTIRRYQPDRRDDPYYEDYVGPAAIVQAHRFIFDSRNRDVGKHLEAMDDREGVWRCRTIHNCTRACPRDIKVMKSIAEVKQAILWGRV
ncbi:MAG: hypothetical protein Q8W44_13690 [Candidatus Palauibacterales bacterium]|nr:hypothetical protein [Candidatus Palauibacterales bacterium]